LRPAVTTTAYIHGQFINCMLSSAWLANYSNLIGKKRNGLVVNATSWIITVTAN
jgi:hypothetical protein